MTVRAVSAVRLCACDDRDMWFSSSSAAERRAQEDPWGFARAVSADFMAGRISGQSFVAAMHQIGHQGPHELQDLVELDDEYLFGNDPDAEDRFRTNEVMEVLVGRARELLVDR